MISDNDDDLPYEYSEEFPRPSPRPERPMRPKSPLFKSKTVQKTEEEEFKEGVGQTTETHKETLPKSRAKRSLQESRKSYFETTFYVESSEPYLSIPLRYCAKFFDERELGKTDTSLPRPLSGNLVGNLSEVPSEKPLKSMSDKLLGFDRGIRYAN